MSQSPASQMAAMLSAASGADMNARNQAQAALENAEKTACGEYMGALIALMSEPQAPEHLRFIAGTQIKNALGGTSFAIQDFKKQRWLALDGNLRIQIKGGLLRLLCDRSPKVAKSAAIAVAKMGEVELSAQQWPELCTQLHDNITNSTQQAGGDVALAAQVRQFTLNAMGYLCEYLYEADVNLDPQSTSKLLTAIIFCMDEKQPPAIRHASMQALSESMPFATNNFANPDERNVIMKKICEATQMQGTDEDSTKTRRFAYVCMTIVAHDYYEYLPDYVQVLFQLTVQAIQNDQEEVSHYALEFWNTLCDTEEDIALEQEQAQLNNTQPSRECKNYVRAAIEHLIPVVFDAMCKQTEDDEEGALCIQAACCMQLCGAVVGDDVLQHVMPLVMKHITNPQNWHLREAATYAFGAIMDGCSVQAVGQYAAQSLPTLVKMVLEEQHPKTRETAAWTLSRVCEYQYAAVPPASMEHIVRAALTGLSDQQGGVCHQCCTMLHRIALNQNDSDNENANTNLLSQYFNTVLQELTKTSGRQDHQEHNLRMASHEALNLWIENSAVDCLQTITALLPPILQRLQGTLSMPLSEQTELHPRLLSTVNVCLNRLYSSDTNTRPNLALNFCDQVMQSALTILASNNDAPVAEAECLLVIMAVITATDEDFFKYIAAAYPYIKKAIEKTDAINVSKCGISIIGDATQALGQKMLPYCDDIMESFVKILRNHLVEKQIKLTVFTSFGSIALSIGASFEKYLPVVMTLMREAATVQLPENADEETLEYMTDLRSEIMSSYTCILQGMNDSQRQSNLVPYIQSIFDVIQTVVIKEINEEEVMNHTVGLIGDLADVFGSQIAPLINQYQAPIQQCLNKCQQGDGQELAQFAQQKIQSAVSGGN